MIKNMKARAIGVVILSAILFVLPVGAILANRTMTSEVYASGGAGAPTATAENTTENTTDNITEDATEEPSDVYVTPNVVITITAPGGWSNDTAKVSVSATDALHTGNFEIVKIEAKIGQNGSWTDITEDRYIEVSENCSVYVQVTDKNGKVYSKNRSIKCFDTTNPTLNAAVSNGLLSIVGYDNDSGIKAFYVNGYEFTEFTNSTLNIRLQQFDTGYQYFTVQAMDNAGNMSEVYKTSNPYYDDDTSDDDDKGASTLPTNATASSPSSATATVTEHVNTDSDGNAIPTSAQATTSQATGDDDTTESETGKEFYTIQTESEKVFYLIIDRDGDDETVYFLTEIDENDLLNTTSNNSETLPKNSAAVESAIPTSDAALSNNNTGSDVSETDGDTSEDEATAEDTTEVPEAADDADTSDDTAQGNMATYIIFGILAVIVIGGWYYLKKVKGKKEGFLDEDDEDDDEEEVVYESDDEGSSGDEFFEVDDEEKSEAENSEDTEDDSDTSEK
jgi:hypothetical protein